MSEDPRDALPRLAKERHTTLAALSRMLRRNHAYLQQYVKRGSPAKLEDRDRKLLAVFFGVDEEVFGGPPKPKGKTSGPVSVPILSVSASAGPGALVDGERTIADYGFDRRWLRGISAANPDNLSIIKVSGDSMAPTLADGADILVDRSDAAERLRDGIYVLRRDDTLMVKRLSVHPIARTLTIASDNPAYPTWHDCPREEVEVIGRVVWVGFRL